MNLTFRFRKLNKSNDENIIDDFAVKVFIEIKSISP